MKSPCFKTDIIKISDYLGAHIDSGAKHFVIECLDSLPNDREAYQIARKRGRFYIFRLKITEMVIKNAEIISDQSPMRS